MTEHEALKCIVATIGKLTYGEERWKKINGCWYDRKNRDYVQNEQLVERVGNEVKEFGGSK